jgi:hypothetical protein
MWRRVDVLLTDVSEEHRLHLQGIRHPRTMNQREQVVYSHLLTLVNRSRISYILKMEAICSSETSGNKISTRRHIPEDDILPV